MGNMYHLPLLRSNYNNNIIFNQRHESFRRRVNIEETPILMTEVFRKKHNDEEEVLKVGIFPYYNISTNTNIETFPAPDCKHPIVIGLHDFYDKYWHGQCKKCIDSNGIKNIYLSHKKSKYSNVPRFTLAIPSYNLNKVLIIKEKKN